ncbi:MAG: EamA family transporter, partial [Bacilli bacterium]
KRLALDALVSLWIETILVTPLALVGVGSSMQMTGELSTWALLIMAGPMTAIPLLLYGMGNQRIPLSLVGILQYLSPTISLLLGVLVYGEHLTPMKTFGFLGVWIAIVLFTFDSIRETRKRAVVA